MTDRHDSDAGDGANVAALCDELRAVRRDLAALTQLVRTALEETPRGWVRPAFMQLKAAAAFVDLAPNTVRRAVERGELRAYLTSSGRTRRLLFKPEDLVAWVERTFRSADTTEAQADALVANVFGGRRRA